MRRNIVTSLVAELAATLPIWQKIAKFMCLALFNGGSRGNFSQRCLVLGKLQWVGYHLLKKYDDMLSRFDTIPERDRQTDRQTDRQNCCINIARQR